MKKCQRIAAKIGSSCTYQEECTIPFSTNSVCRNNICICKEESHFVPKEGACFKTSCKLSLTVFIKKKCLLFPVLDIEIQIIKISLNLLFSLQ